MGHLKIYLLLAAISVLLMQCTKTATTSPRATETDAGLYARATAPGLAYYRHDTTIYHAAAPSAHHGYIRVRFNDIALAALTDHGKLPTGATFPTGSLVVKELHHDSLGTGLFGYAIMEKLPADSNQASGWVWGEYTLTLSGTMVNTRGASCTGCHSMDSRDMVRVFDLFP